MYKDFARIYDVLMASFPYKEYQQIIDQLLPPRGKVLEIGCGSGMMTDYFFHRGAEVHALDISESMLSYAKRKFPSVNFYLGELEQMRLGTFEQIYACVDVVNYYLNEEDLRDFFIAVKNHLSGRFLFDLRHPQAMENDLAEKIFYYEEEQGDLVWINEKEGDILYQEIVIYWNEGGVYSKNTEIHYQRIWSSAMIESLLLEAGLNLVEKIENTDRIYYLCGLT